MLNLLWVWSPNLILKIFRWKLSKSVLFQNLCWTRWTADITGWFHSYFKIPILGTHKKTTTPLKHLLIHPCPLTWIKYHTDKLGIVRVLLFSSQKVRYYIMALCLLSSFGFYNIHSCYIRYFWHFQTYTGCSETMKKGVVSKILFSVNS